MKRWRSHTVCRPLAWILAGLLVAPYLAWPGPARAQQTAPAVYVLDFNNRTRVGGALLGRVAAAQVALQLAESPNWDVIPETQVQQQIQQLGLHPPFDRVDRQRIGAGIDAQAVVYGTILEASVAPPPMVRASVRLQVVVEDLITGVLINGAVAEGTSTPRMGFTGDADILLEEALGKAAFRARELMDRFRLPEGTVLNTTVVGTVDNPQLDALINIGARQGVRRGMEMVVTRQKQLVGRMKITLVDSDISTGRVTENLQGVRPEDRVRAIFNFADFPITRTRMRSAEPAALPQASAPAGARPGAESGSPEKGAPESGGPVRVARAPREAEFVPFRARQEAGAQLAQDTVQPPPPVVVDELEVERERSDRVGPGRFITRNAFRLLVGGLLVLGLLALGGRQGNQATRPHGLADRTSGWQFQIGAPGAFIRVAWDRPNSIRSTQVLQYIIWRADRFGSLQIVGALNTDAVRVFYDSESPRTFQAFDGQPGSDDAGALTSFTNVPGIVPGEQYRYQIATAYRSRLVDLDGDGTPDDQNVMSPLSMTSPWVTAIRPPTITSPTSGTQVQLDQLEVTWQQTPGADLYVIRVSTDPNFRSNVREFGPFQFVPVNQGGPPTVSATIDATSPSFLEARTLYITVGGRNSNDANPPEPFGAIFSAPVSVQPEEVPPPPPGFSRTRPLIRNGGDRSPGGGRTRPLERRR